MNKFHYFSLKEVKLWEENFQEVSKNIAQNNETSQNNYKCLKKVGHKNRAEYDIPDTLQALKSDVESIIVLAEI